MYRRMFVAMLMVVLAAPALRAQDKPAAAPAEGGNNGGDRGRGRDRGGNNGGNNGGNDQERRDRYSNYIKERLGEVTDDEWKVIQPKLQKVQDVRREQMSGMMGGFGGRGGDRGGNNNETQSTNPVATATSDLKKALDNKSASAEEITKKLTALRQAKEKAKTELTAAQKELKDVLTQRQEAALVMMGMLD